MQKMFTGFIGFRTQVWQLFLILSDISNIQVSEYFGFIYLTLISFTQFYAYVNVSFIYFKARNPQ